MWNAAPEGVVAGIKKGFFAQLLLRGRLEVVYVKQALGLKMRQVCFVEKETFLADQKRNPAAASHAKLLKVLTVHVGHRHAQWPPYVLATFL